METSEPVKAVEGNVKSANKSAPAWKPTNRLAAYGSALPLNGGGPNEDDEKKLQEWQERQEARKREGTAGEWQSVALPRDAARLQEAETVAAATPTFNHENSSYIVREKQGHFRELDNEEIAAEIKVKKRIKVQSKGEMSRQAQEEEKQMMPCWKPMKLDTSIAKKDAVQPVAAESRDDQNHNLSEESSQPNTGEAATPEVEPVQETQSASTSMFKKRKSGAGAGAKRVKADI